MPPRIVDGNISFPGRRPGGQSVFDLMAKGRNKRPISPCVTPQAVHFSRPKFCRRVLPYLPGRIRFVGPMTFPLARSSRSTMLVAAGSVTPTKTIGILRVLCWRATVAGGLPANPRMAPGTSPFRSPRA
jgi:hypothetical protein